MYRNVLDLKQLNKELRGKNPQFIIDWAMTLSHKAIVTTSFGKYSAVLLHTFFKRDSQIPVVWCDSGYNLPETYKHALFLMNKFKLNMQVYVPLQSKAYIDMTLGFPDVGSSEHKQFTEIVKLEPFRRALQELQPKIWFTNIRIRQNAYRNSKDILSFSKDGILKVSPYYYWSDDELDRYLKQNDLPKNTHYFDPIKASANRECGIHFE